MRTDTEWTNEVAVGIPRNLGVTVVSARIRPLALSLCVMVQPFELSKGEAVVMAWTTAA